MESESGYSKEQWAQHLATVQEIEGQAKGRLDSDEIIRLARLLDNQKSRELTPEESAERTQLMAKAGGKDIESPEGSA